MTVAESLVATTWQCNLRCRYCFVDKTQVGRSGARMTPQTAARVVDALDQGLPELDGVCIHLYGGEPLTNLPALRAMVERASRLPDGRISFAITTNGTVLDPEVFELLEAGRFQVILSIDGPAEVHDEVRRTADDRPTHARVVRFLELLRERTRCWVRGSSVVRSGWSLVEAEGYLRSLGVDAIKAQFVRGPTGTPYALTPAERQAYMHHLTEVGRQVIDDLESGRPPLDDRFSNRVLQLLVGRSRDHYCRAAQDSFGIAPDGAVVPCVLLDAETHRLGHIDDPPETWRRQGERWLASQRRDQACETCEALPLCGGGCPAISPVCGPEECDIVRKNCEVARDIRHHFRDDPTALLALAGIL